MKKPKGLVSGEVLRIKSKKRTLSVQDKLDMVMDMIIQSKECHACGTIKEIGYLTPKQARKILGFK
jgi:hypothetical protein